ncbi:hypothetical protein H9P43_006578 [Blastocladiella emersonii ATCC 22665]|nr:hypothetical protein H9P43_006578 [Blastocladiella emersonii ATCC 22665]
MVAHRKPPVSAGVVEDIVLFAVDDSGSTNYEREYWKRVGERFDEYRSLYGGALRVLRWDTSELETSHKQLLANIERMNSRSGTDPTCVARYITRNRARFNVIKMCIITDGQIDRTCVQRCDRELAAIPGGIPDVEACLFGRFPADLSVVAPFARSANFLIRHNDAVLAEGCARVAVEGSGVLDAIRTPAELFIQYEKLRKLIVVQNLGRANTKLRDELIKLQKRLLDVIAQENARKLAAAESVRHRRGSASGDAGAAESSSSQHRYPHPILDPLREGDYESAVAATRELLYGIADSADDAKKVGDCITKLVQACTVSSFGLDTLQSHRATRAGLATVPESEVPVAEVADASESAAAAASGGGSDERFECPIMLDDDTTPVLLITESASFADDGGGGAGGGGTTLGVLEGADTAVIDDVTDCPLNILKYPALVDRLVDRLDHAIGSAAFTGLFNEAAAGGAYRWKDIVSPYTRRTVVGCIPLGTAAQHVELGTWVVRQMATRGVKLGNPHLWLAAVYLAIRERRVPQLADNAAFMAAFRAHLVCRFEHPMYATNIALSGQPGYPVLKAPVAAALWYSLTGATQLFAADPEQYAQERLRQWYPIGAHLRHLVEDVLQYPVVPASGSGGSGGEVVAVAGLDVLDERIRVLRVFGYLMSRKQDVAALKLDVARLYQNHLVIPHVAMGGGGAAKSGGGGAATTRAAGTATATTAVPLTSEPAVVVLVDGPCTPEQAAASPLAWLLDVLPLPRILDLLQLVDPSKRVGSVFLPPAELRRSGNSPVVAVRNYGYAPGFTTAGLPTPICPATLRPWTVDYRDSPQRGEHWTARTERVHGAPLAAQLSAYNLFLEYVASRKAYPKSIASLVAFYAQRQARRSTDPKSTLPEQVDATARGVIQAYKTAFAQRVGGIPTPAEFLRIIEASRNRDTRLAMEIKERAKMSAKAENV